MSPTQADLSTFAHSVAAGNELSARESNMLISIPAPTSTGAGGCCKSWEAGSTRPCRSVGQVGLGDVPRSNPSGEADSVP